MTYGLTHSLAQKGIDGGKEREGGGGRGLLCQPIKAGPCPQRQPRPSPTTAVHHPSPQDSTAAHHRQKALKSKVYLPAVRLSVLQLLSLFSSTFYCTADLCFRGLHCRIAAAPSCHYAAKAAPRPCQGAEIVSAMPPLLHFKKRDALGGN